VRELGLDVTHALERELKQHRTHPHFLAALIMAQKQEATECPIELTHTDSLPVPQPASPTAKRAPEAPAQTTLFSLLGN
jgi:hypothetical protein